MAFRFQRGQLVRVKDTDEVGEVIYCSTEPTLEIPFCQVRFDGGRMQRVAESDLVEVGEQR